MNTPLIIGGIYRHPTLIGHRLYRLLAVTEHDVVIRPIAGRRRPLIEDTLNHFTAGCYVLVDEGTSDEELLALANAVGIVPVVDDPDREPGEQPAVEFATGPVGPGPLWSDDNLAREFFGGDAS